MAKKLKKLIARVTALEKAVAGILSSKKPARKKAKRMKARKATARRTKKAARNTRRPGEAKKSVEALHTGMMGDGTEEQNLGQRGAPGLRIRNADVAAAFGSIRR